MSEPQFLYLTTTGWKSGKPHEIEIWFVGYEGNFYIVSEHYEKSHWVQNIMHNSAIYFRVGEHEFYTHGRILDHDAEPDLVNAVSALMDQKYGWSKGLIVELSGL